MFKMRYEEAAQRINVQYSPEEQGAGYIDVLGLQTNRALHAHNNAWHDTRNLYRRLYYAPLGFLGGGAALLVLGHMGYSIAVGGIAILTAPLLSVVGTVVISAWGLLTFGWYGSQFCRRMQQHQVTYASVWARDTFQVNEHGKASISPETIVLVAPIVIIFERENSRCTVFRYIDVAVVDFPILEGEPTGVLRHEGQPITLVPEMVFYKSEWSNFYALNQLSTDVYVRIDGALYSTNSEVCNQDIKSTISYTVLPGFTTNVALVLETDGSDDIVGPTANLRTNDAGKCWVLAVRALCSTDNVIRNNRIEKFKRLKVLDVLARMAVNHRDYVDGILTMGRYSGSNTTNPLWHTIIGHIHCRNGRLNTTDIRPSENSGIVVITSHFIKRRDEFIHWGNSA